MASRSLSARNVLELVSEVARVEDIEGFEEESEFLVLAQIEELRNAHIQLRKAVAAYRVQRQLVLIIDARVNRFAVVGHAIFIDVAHAGWKDAVRTGRSHLKNRRELEVPRQIENAGEDETMAFVLPGGSEVDRVKFYEQVLWLQAEVRGCPKPRLRFRERVVRIQLVLVRVTFLERHREGIVTRTAIGLGHGNAAKGVAVPNARLTRLRVPRIAEPGYGYQGLSCCVAH